MAKKKPTKTESRADQLQRELSDRVGEVTEELTGVVGRLRATLDEARPVAGGELAALRAEVALLAKRVEALEKAGNGSRRSGSSTTGRRTPASSARKSGTSRASANSAKQVTAARAAAKRGGSRS